MKVLVVDNYDSFVYTLNGYLQQLGAETDVVRNDAFDADAAGDRLADYDAVLLSPGPGTPAAAGVSIPVVHAALESGQPLLGVCLGHQVIGHVYGGTVGRAPELVHGKTSPVHHQGAGVLAGLPVPFAATRYHSLVVAREGLPDVLEVTAETEDGTVMGLRHRDLPIETVQYHPEGAPGPLDALAVFDRFVFAAGERRRTLG